MPIACVRKLGPIALALAATACRVDVTPPTATPPAQPSPRVEVSATRFSWTTDSVVRYRITNPAAAPVYWQCPLEALQYFRGGWHTTAWGTSVACPAGVADLRLLARGDSIAEGHRLANDLCPVAGWYRFAFRLYRDPAGTALWDEAGRVSPAFFVGR